MPWPANPDEFFNKHLTVYPMINPQTPAPALNRDRLMEELLLAMEEQTKREVAERIADDSLHPVVRVVRQPAPAVVPVAVAERPWEREGWCDAEGRCWAEHISREGTVSWRLTKVEDLGGWCARVLPAHAIPIPQPPLGGEVQP